MKRLALPALWIAYVALGVGLLVEMAKPREPAPLTILLHSEHTILSLDEWDLSDTRFVTTHPHAKVLVKIEGGKPSHLNRLPEGLFDSDCPVILINPAGIIVGPDAGLVERLGETQSTLETPLPPASAILDWKAAPRETTIPFPNIDEFDGANRPRGRGAVTNAVAELEAHGNVYALAIQREGTLRATASIEATSIPKRVRINPTKAPVDP